MVEAIRPHSTKAEEGVLGSILLAGQEVFDEVAYLSPVDFYHERHRAIFSAMAALALRHAAIDVVTVEEEIIRAGRNDLFVEDPMYLIELINRVPTSGNVRDYARVVKDLSIAWEVIIGMQKALGPAYRGRPDEAMDILEQTLTAIKSGRPGETFLTPVRALSSPFFSRLDELHQNKQLITGVPTGIRDLDRLTGGLQRSDLIVLAARPGVGKTALAMTIAGNAASAYGKRVAVFTMEMSREQLYTRLISTRAGIDQHRLRTGWIDDEEWERIIEAMQELDAAPIFLDDTPGLTCQDIERKVRFLTFQSGAPDLVIVDYLGLMRNSGKRSENRVQEVSEIVRDLKEVARKLNLPILCLSQLSRTLEHRQSKVPQLSDLRETGEIEQAADLVWFIYRDDVYNPDSERANIADIIIAKHRNGPTGTVSTYFQKSHTVFCTLEETCTEEEASYA